MLVFVLSEHAVPLFSCPSPYSHRSVIYAHRLPLPSHIHDNSHYHPHKEAWHPPRWRLPRHTIERSRRRGDRGRQTGRGSATLNHRAGALKKADSGGEAGEVEAVFIGQKVRLQLQMRKQPEQGMSPEGRGRQMVLKTCPLYILSLTAHQEQWAEAENLISDGNGQVRNGRRA